MQWDVIQTSEEGSSNTYCNMGVPKPSLSEVSHSTSRGNPEVLKSETRSRVAISEAAEVERRNCVWIQRFSYTGIEESEDSDIGCLYCESLYHGT